MHHDKTQTHVISCIFHLASSENAEAWPIVLEDYTGSTNSVLLKPGDILLYESAKVFHGRPNMFIGDWYTSVFCHFYPKTGWRNDDHLFDAHYAVPPTWRETHPSTLPKMEWYHTNVREPECNDGWCNLEGDNFVEWEGPGEYGTVLTAGGKRYSIDIRTNSNTRNKSEL